MSAFWRRYSAWVWLGTALIVIAALKIASVPASAPAALAADNPKSNGALALSLWLRRAGYTVSRADGADLGLSGLSTRDTMLVLRPDAQLRRAALDSALGWVRSGGTLVAATSWDGTQALERRLGYRVLRGLDLPVRVSQPLLVAPPARNISGTAGSVLDRGFPGVAVARSGTGPVLLMRRWGRGVVWILTIPGVLDNGDLAHGDNRRLALNLAGAPGRKVEFDEYTGAVVAAPAVQNWLVDTAWGVAALFVLAILLLYRFLSGWRLGPPVIPLQERHRAGVEYVLGMADLLQRGHKAREALLTYQNGLRQLLRRVSPAAEEPTAMLQDAQIQRLLAPHDQLDDRELLDRVREIVECEEHLARNGTT